MPRRLSARMAGAAASGVDPRRWKSTITTSNGVGRSSTTTRLFEKVALESFQSGLSWRTILAKRDNFRAAFAGFDFDKVARFGDRDRERLLADAGIVRHRGKIDATIANAKAACELRDAEGSLARFFGGTSPTRRRAPRASPAPG